MTARPGCTTIGAGSGRAVFFCGENIQGVMIMVIVNGEPKEVAGMTVLELLSSMQLKPERTAVMIGNDILPKPDYGKVLTDGETVEIIGFVGGG